MANNNKRNFTIMAIIGLVITLIGIIVGIVKGYTIIEVESKHQNEARIELKNEGCLPARENKTNIEVIQKDIEIIKDVQQKQDIKLDKILEKL